jgi:hypothetical protein
MDFRDIPQVLAIQLASPSAAHWEPAPTKIYPQASSRYTWRNRYGRRVRIRDRAVRGRGTRNSEYCGRGGVPPEGNWNRAAGRSLYGARRRNPRRRHFSKCERRIPAPLNFTRGTAFRSLGAAATTISLLPKTLCCSLDCSRAVRKTMPSKTSGVKSTRGDSSLSKPVFSLEISWWRRAAKSGCATGGWVPGTMRYKQSTCKIHGCSPWRADANCDSLRECSASAQDEEGTNGHYVE